MIFPAVAPNAILTEMPLFDLFFLGTGELMLGLSMGLMARLFLIAVDLGAEVMGFQMGFGIVTAIDPSTQASTAILSQLYGAFMVLMLLVANGHHYFFIAITESFRTIPLMGFSPNSNLFTLFMDSSKQIFVVALKFAAPVMVVLLLTSVALGIVARTVPQMNIFMVGMSLKIFIGFSVMLFSASMMGLIFEQQVIRMGEMLFRFAGAF